MSDSERSVLVKQMDDDLEEHFKKLEEKAKLNEGKRIEGGWSEEKWEEEMQQHPFFNSGWQEGKELSPMMQGLQDLKYSPDENTPEELAVSYKEDGNFNFKCKKYRFAIASYTEGLKSKSSDIMVNVQLFTNRAASQYHISNFRSSLQDCERAVRLSPTHMKAILRGAQCCMSLKQYQNCQNWCDKGIKVEPKHVQLTQLRQEASKLLKQKERDERRMEIEKTKKKEKDNKILEMLRSKNICIQRKKRRRA